MLSTIPEYRYGCSMDNFRIVTAQEEDDASDILRLWPVCEIGVRHGIAICLPVDDAGKDGVHSHARTLCVSGKRIDHGQRGRLGSGVCGRTGSMIVGCFGWHVYDRCALVPDPHRPGA